jgi:hypothetical protein
MIIKNPLNVDNSLPGFHKINLKVDAYAMSEKSFMLLKTIW